MSKNTSLGKRIKWAVIALVAVLVLITLVIVDITVRQGVDENILTQLSNTRIAFKELTDSRQEQILSKTNFFLSSGIFKKDYKAASKLKKNKIVADFEKITQYKHFILIGLDGTIYASSTDKDVGAVVTERYPDSFIKNLEKAVEKGRHFSTWNTDDMIIQGVFVPVVKGGVPVAVVAAGAALDDKLAFKIDEITRNQISAFADGKLIASAFNSTRHAELKSQIDLMKSNLTLKMGNPKDKTLFDITIAKEDYLASAWPFDSEGKSFFVIASNKDKQLAMLTTIEIVIAITGTVGILVAILFSVLLSRNLTKSVNKLVLDVGKVKEGNLDHPIVSTSEDEIGYIAENFDEMRKAFKGSQQKLKDYADNLEEKVAERTAELSKSTEIIQKAKQEQDRIFATVEQGLFLVNSEDGSYKIGNEYSEALKKIIEADDPGGKELVKVLNQLPDKSKKSLIDYLDLMFKNTIGVDVLKNLNPLREIELKVNKPEKGKLNEKHLKFSFSRVSDGKNVSHLMGTVSDITQSVVLAKKLKETEEKNKSQMELLFSILHVDPSMLMEFVEDARIELDTIDEVLKPNSPKFDKFTLKEKLEQIYRSVHTIKGNSSLLSLSFIAERAHVYEDKVGELLEQDHVSGGDFLPLVLKLNELRDLLKEVNGIISRLQSFQSKTSEVSNESYLIKSMRSTIEKMSKEMEKEVDLRTENFRDENIPEKYKKFTKDVLVQLVRNSMHHGLETTKARLAAKKPEKGIIEIKAGNEKDHFVISIRDDGQGLNIPKIREKAIAGKKYTKQEVDEMSDEKVAQLIFVSGLSTAESASMTAGRGVGMDIIKSKVDDLKGKIGIGFKAGQYSEFKIFLPI